MNPLLTPEMIKTIQKILDKGNQVEVKIEKSEIVIIEIRRKKRY